MTHNKIKILLVDDHGVDPVLVDRLVLGIEPAGAHENRR